MEQRIQQTIEHIAHRWEGVNRELLLPVFPLLANGRPVALDAVDSSGRHGVAEVHGQLSLAGADFDDAGRVVGLGGIGLAGGSFSVVLGETSLSTCCAITAHAVPMLLGCSAIVRTRDPVSEQDVALTLDPEAVTVFEPAGAVASFVPLNATQRLPGLGDRFCNYVRYFEGELTAHAHKFGDRSYLLLDPREVHEAAKLWVQLVWGMTLA